MVIGKWRKYLAASKLTIGIEANPSTKVIPSSPKSFLNQTMTLFFLENFLSLGLAIFDHQSKTQLPAK